MNDVVVSILKFTDLTLFPENGREDVFYFDESTYKIYSFDSGGYTEQFTGSPFTGGVVPNATTFQDDVTFQKGIITGYVEKTANYTIISSDYTINCISGTFTVTLPTAVGIAGRVFEITNTGSGRITLATLGSETIQGDLTQKIFKDECFVVRSTGLNWIVV